MKTTMKMMLSFFLMVASVSVMAQDKRMITVHNGNNLQVFYGDCFAAAVNAAQSGDTLTLSKGDFSGVTINKPLVIQGAGYRNGTTINGNIYIALPEEDAEGVVIEGVCLPVRTWSSGDYRIGISRYAKKLVLRRCLICTVGFGSIPSDSCRIEQCRIYQISGLSQCRDLFVTNSIIEYLNSPGTTGSVVADHCIIWSLSDYVICRNSFVRDHITRTEGTPLYNCIYGSSSNSPTINCRVFNFNLLGFNVSDWENTMGVPTDPESTIDISTDGTQIGVYGGTLGFTEQPLNPQITSSEIAREVDADGKLSVKITVEAAKE